MDSKLREEDAGTMVRKLSRVDSYRLRMREEGWLVGPSSRSQTFTRDHQGLGVSGDAFVREVPTQILDGDDWRE